MCSHSKRGDSQLESGCLHLQVNLHEAIRDASDVATSMEKGSIHSSRRQDHLVEHNGLRGGRELAAQVAEEVDSEPLRSLLLADARRLIVGVLAHAREAQRQRGSALPIVQLALRL